MVLVHESQDERSVRAVERCEGDLRKDAPRLDPSDVGVVRRTRTGGVQSATLECTLATAPVGGTSGGCGEQSFGCILPRDHDQFAIVDRTTARCKPTRRNAASTRAPAGCTAASTSAGIDAGNRIFYDGTTISACIDIGRRDTEISDERDDGGSTCGDVIIRLIGCISFARSFTVNSLTSAPATNADSGVPNGVDDTVMPPPIPLAQFTSSRPSSTSSSTYTSPNGRNSQSQPQSYQPQPYSHSRPDSSASSSSGMFSSPTINGPNPSMGQRGAPPQAMYAPNNGSNMNGTMNNMNYYGTPYSTAPNSNQSTPQQQQHQQRSAYPPNGAFNPYQQQASPPQQFPNNNQPSQSMPYYPSAPNSVGPMPSSTQNTPASSSARPSNSTDYLMQQLLHEQYLMHQQQQLANQYAQQRLRAPATTRAASRASTATNGRSRTASASRTTNGTPQATPAGMSAIAQQRLAMMQSALALTATPSSASTPALHLTPSNIATAPYGTPQTQPPPFRSSSLEPRNPRSGSASSRKTTPSRGNDSAYLSVLNHHAIKKYNQHSAPPPPKPHFHGLYNGTHTKNERRAF